MSVAGINIGREVFGAILVTAVVTTVASLIAVLTGFTIAGLGNIFQVIIAGVLASVFSATAGRAIPKGGILVSALIFALALTVTGMLVFGQALSLQPTFLVGIIIVYIVSQQLWNMGQARAF